MVFLYFPASDRHFSSTETVHLAEALKTPVVGWIALSPLNGHLYRTITQFVRLCAQELLLVAHQVFSFILKFNSGIAGLTAARPRRVYSAVTTPQRGAGDLCLLVNTSPKRAL